MSVFICLYSFYYYRLAPLLLSLNVSTIVVPRLPSAPTRGPRPNYCRHSSQDLQSSSISVPDRLKNFRMFSGEPVLQPGVVCSLVGNGKVYEVLPPSVWRQTQTLTVFSFSQCTLCFVYSGLKIAPVSWPFSNGRIVFLCGVDSFLMMFVCWSYLRVGDLPLVFALAAVVLVYSRPWVDRVAAAASLHPCKASERAKRRTKLGMSSLETHEQSLRFRKSNTFHGV